MQKRKFGNSDLQVSQLGLGCMGMSEFYGSYNDEESNKVIHYAIENGINFFDTADMYGSGKNETLVGKALSEVRDKVVIATKFGILRGEGGSFTGINGKPEYVKQSCEKSLQRLDMDHIDLYYQHRVDPNTPIEDTVGAMADLVKEGKVRYLGLSEASEEIIRRAHKVHPIAAVQTEYSLWSNDLEAVIPVCRELDIALVPYSPLGRGFLSGKFKSLEDFEENDFRRYNPRFSAENFNKNLEILNVVEEIAKSKSVTPSQIALAWVISKGDDMFPIPGTKRINYLKENITAIDIKLEKDEIEQLDSLYNLVSGKRY
ncbi:MAG: aldo/keto reductase [Ignavibacteria bacterium]|nr:aldo/keto reductase [Ignavibacteria bacterium]MBK9405890.1 aldo/keto reductase [Ignavibacteria bacterium]